MSAVDLGRLIGTRSLSPVEVLDAVFERIETQEPSIHAFLTITEDIARTEARKAEQRVLTGSRLSALDGIPYSIKDLEDTRGIRTTYGSTRYAEHVPAVDGSAASRLRASGGVLLGKTDTPQFGHKDSSDNLLGPATRNPWRLDCTAGGSSGGAAAAVCAGVGPVAHGTDGAGSVRIPASYCGVVGYKPSAGRIPYIPKVDYWVRTATHGSLARTVADAALLADVMAGYDRRDPLSISEPSNLLEATTESFTGIRVRFSLDFGYGIVDSEVASVCRSAAIAFDESSLVEEGDPGWEHPGSFPRVLFEVAYAFDCSTYLDEHPDWVEGTLQRLIRNGRGYGGLDYAEALSARSRFYEKAVDAFRTFDLLVAPTTPVTAWPADYDPGSELQGPWEINGEDLPALLRRNFLVHPFNLTGFPAVSVPCGFTSAGLPVGLQIVAGPGQDRLVLRAAAFFEAARPWQQWSPHAVHLAQHAT
jgi:Asp-tRNA(Asn)/Glu-tRNA(Gln) amidotransferase A subunit family amidase